MNLLAHFLLAEHSQTSYAGQVLGDMVKGRLDTRFPPPIRTGITLHRHIDSVSDSHPLHRAMRNRFPPPFRRYAGILVDIGFDAGIARAWPAYSDQSLADFAAQAQRRVIDEWPDAAPGEGRRMTGLAGVLSGYARDEGIQRALDSVAARLRRANPVADALPHIRSESDAFDRALPQLMTDLRRTVLRYR